MRPVKYVRHLSICHIFSVNTSEELAQTVDRMIAEAVRGLFKETEVPRRRVGRDENVLVELVLVVRNIRRLHSVNGGYKQIQTGTGHPPTDALENKWAGGPAVH